MQYYLNNIFQYQRLQRMTANREACRQTPKEKGLNRNRLPQIDRVLSNARYTRVDHMQNHTQFNCIISLGVFEGVWKCVRFG